MLISIYITKGMLTLYLDVNKLIEEYGYIALLIGCLSEGETFTILSGVAVHEGLLHFGWAILTAIIGGTLGDQLLFWIGRRYGYYILNRFKRYQVKLNKATYLIKKNPSLFVIGVRFMYGLRIIGPIIIGASKLNPIKFLLFNIIGSILWAVVFITLGYFAGALVTLWLHKFKKYLKHLLYLIFVIIFAIILIILFRKRKIKR